MDKEKEPTMSLKAQLSDAIKNAMRNKEKDKLTTLRMYSAAIKQREVDERKELEEDECLKVLTTMIKQRKEAFKQYEEAGRSDLAEKEVAEIKILEDFLPEQLSEEERIVEIAQMIVRKSAEFSIDLNAKTQSGENGFHFACFSSRPLIYISIYELACAAFDFNPYIESAPFS